MKPATGLGLMLSAIALELWTRAERRAELAAKTLGLTVAAIGLEGLLENFAHEEFVPSPFGAAPMALGSALGVAAAGLAISLVDKKPWRAVRPSEVLAALAALIGLSSTYGYVFGVEGMYRLPSSSSVS